MSPHDVDDVRDLESEKGGSQDQSSSGILEEDSRDLERPSSGPLAKQDIVEEAVKLDRCLTHTLSSSISDEVLVDWDGPNDPNNPKNWSNNRKWAATLIVACFTFVSPVSSSIIAPASNNVAADFGITKNVVVDMITSIFVLGFAIGPLLVGPLSEIFGRSKVIQFANVFFLVWNLACGFAQNTTQLIVFRFFAGIGGSAPLAIGGAVIGDTFHPEQRGGAMAIYALGPMLGPAVGPVAGAWIAERVSWRWVFWCTTIFDVIVQIAGVLYLQETYAPVLLERKARRMAKSLASDAEKGNGKPPPQLRTIYDGQLDRSWQAVFSAALTRPFMLFFCEPILQVLGIYMAFIYGIFYLSITTMPTIFINVYHQSVGIMGLNYIALGAGMAFASYANSKTMDRIYMYYKHRNGGIGEPEFRVPTIVPASIAFPIGILLSGWAAQEHIHWIVADIGFFLIGCGMILAFQSIQTYIVDVFTLYAASGIAAVGCLRALFGFGFPLFADSMYDALGFGKGNTILAVVAVIIGCPAPWIFWFYGKKIRLASNYAKK